ncbi:hypothetical protein TIFTF001_020564 [Ficus carica]|uniref:Uncharacterized protein n=1 Tax=Ficus carica TaxID=3494 RepID=A0AA88DDS1_FICCA|nr:hypothetical protein TIFTF001_020564 [Ficus carica]
MRHPSKSTQPGLLRHITLFPGSMDHWEKKMGSYAGMMTRSRSGKYLDELLDHVLAGPDVVRALGGLNSTTSEVRRSSNLATTACWTEDFLLTDAALVTDVGGSRYLWLSRLVLARGLVELSYSSRIRLGLTTGGSAEPPLTEPEP